MLQLCRKKLQLWEAATFPRKTKRVAEATLLVESQIALLPSLDWPCWLERLNVFCLPALGSLDDIELNGLTFLQAAEAAGLNCRVVNENVLAVLAADEAITLRVIEPLHCSLFHL